MHYDLVDLRLFLNIADELNVSRGAKRSHMAPSSASSRLTSLEEALGCALFIRRPRGVELTSAGAVLLEHARACLAELQQLHTDLAPYASKVGTQVTLFANNNAISAFLPEDLASFFSAYPHVRVSLEERTSHNIIAAVAAGRADLGIVAWERDQAGLEFLPYKEDELVLVTGVGHRLAKSKRIRFAECLGEPFITLSSGAAIHTYLAGHAAAIGKTMDIRVQVLTYDGILKLVAAGAGVGIVPAAVLHATPHGVLASVSLDEPWANRHLKICVRAAAGADGDRGRKEPRMESLLAAHLMNCGSRRDSQAIAAASAGRTGRRRSGLP